MLTIEERKKIRKLLFHGSCLMIAEKAGVSQKSVSYWFSGKSNSKKIEKATIDLYTESRKNTKQMLKKLELL